MSNSHFSFKLFLVLVLLTLPLLSAAAQEEENFTEINITLIEHEFQVEGQDPGTPLELNTGEAYKLHFLNAGELSHEVLLGRNPIEVMPRVHLDFEENLLQDVEVSIEGVMNDQDFEIVAPGFIEVELMPGQEITLAFTLPEEKAGDWLMACFTFLDPNATDENPGATHHDVGMLLPMLVVTN